MVHEIWLSKKRKNREEEESSDLPAYHISETVSSLVLKLVLHLVVAVAFVKSNGVSFLPYMEPTDIEKALIPVEGFLKNTILMLIFRSCIAS